MTIADDNDLINRVVAALAGRIQPQIPCDDELWNIATIAACMKLSEAQARERLAPHLGLAKAVRLPTTNRERARYRDKDVCAWMMKYQDKH